MWTQYWEEYGLEGLAAISILIIVALCIHNWWTGAQGTYSTTRSLPCASSTPTSKLAEMNMMQHTPNDSKLELQSKFILEEVFRRPFYKIRPDFLKNDVTGYNLEIDLYNDELKLAVEVQGDQHYKFSPYFHRNKEHFLNQRYRDEMKKWKCKANGITLVEVPYKVGEKKLRSYLLEQLRLEGFLL